MRPRKYRKAFFALLHGSLALSVYLNIYKKPLLTVFGGTSYKYQIKKNGDCLFIFHGY